VDHIELRGLRVVGTHGVLPEEQVRAQPFEVDLDVGLDLDGASRSDDLADTLDYGELTGQVADVVAGEHHALLERLAGRIAEVVLSDERVRSVTVTVRKLRPPVAADLGTAAVRLTRSRPDSA
jgi:dihydroneopterin aldolase